MSGLRPLPMLRVCSFFLGEGGQGVGPEVRVEELTSGL